MIPLTLIPLIIDLIIEAKKCKNLDEFLYKVRALRTRPFSRISAIVYTEPNQSLENYCKGIGEREVVDYVKSLGVCKYKSVVIYRGSDNPLGDIEVGDWVALDPKYAAHHGQFVKSKMVYQNDVYWAGTDPQEWYYIPHQLVGKIKDLREFWKWTKSFSLEKILEK